MYKLPNGGIFTFNQEFMYQLQRFLSTAFKKGTHIQTVSNNCRDKFKYGIN